LLALAIALGGGLQAHPARAYKTAASSFSAYYASPDHALQSRHDIHP
jgi:hypothetical protein